MMNYGTNINGRAIQIPRDKNYNGTDQSAIKFIVEVKNRHFLKSPIGFTRKRIKPKVDSEMKWRENELANRRKRLKQLLEEETLALTIDLKEIRPINVINKNKNSEEVIEQEKAVIEDIEKLPHKLIDTDKYEEMNKIINKQRGLEIQKVHELQIKDKKIKREQDKKIEDYWHGIMINDVHNKKIQEQKIARDNSCKISAMKNFLDSQIIRAKEAKEKQVIEAKIKELEQSAEIIKKLELDIMEVQIIEKKKKKKLQEDLMKQINIQKETVKRQKKEELHMENIFCDLANEECKKIKKKIITEQELKRKEVDLFNEHLLSLKTYRRDFEKKIDESILSVAHNKIIETEHQINVLNQRRKELLKNAVIGREIQMNEKKQRAQDLASQEMTDLQNRIQYEKHLKELEKLEKENMIKTKDTYKTYLTEQMRKLKISKDVEDEQLKKAYEANIEEEKKLNEKCAEVMKRESNILSIHPFTDLIKKKQ